MKPFLIVWLIGYVIATALIFVSSKRWSDDIIERLIGALLIGVSSWLYVAIAVAAYLLKREKGRNETGKGGAQ